jgi:hypothetical protein
MVLGAAIAAPAAPVTFAQFQEAPGTPSANLFSYLSAVLDPPSPVTGPSAVLQNNGPSIPVIFTFNSIPGLPADLQGPQMALLTLTSATNATIQPGFGGTLYSELFNSAASDTLTITRVAPAGEGANTKTNLLTLSYTGDLFAAPGGSTAVLTGQSALGFTVNYSSDFLNFGSAGPSDYSVNFTSWTSADGGPVEVPPSPDLPGFFANATAAATGSFDAAVFPSTGFPEPGTLGVVALTGAAAVLRRRRPKTN